MSVGRGHDALGRAVARALLLLVAAAVLAMHGISGAHHAGSGAHPAPTAAHGSEVVLAHGEMVLSHDPGSAGHGVDEGGSPHLTSAAPTAALASVAAATADITPAGPSLPRGSAMCVAVLTAALALGYAALTCVLRRRPAQWVARLTARRLRSTSGPAGLLRPSLAVLCVLRT